MRHFKPTTITAAALAMAALTTACGSKDAETQEPVAAADVGTAEDPGADPRQADYLHACTLKMTAPETREWQTSWDPRGKIMLGEGPSTVHSTYWAGDDEHQKLIDAKSPPLEVNCSYENADGQNEIALGIHGRGQLSEADVAYGPGTYPIVPRSSDPNAPKGFWVFPLLFGTSMFEATSGTLTIERFDDKGMAGSFHFEAKEQIVGDRTMVIDGTFDMPCRGGPSEMKCTAGKAIVD
jgi:hypothetical protein